jgi:hypothetical protein
MHKFQLSTAYLKENISTIVCQEHQCSNAMEVAHPWEPHKAYGSYVMYKHLPEILALYIKKLGHCQWPIKCKGDHVVPPAVWSDALGQIQKKWLVKMKDKLIHNIFTHTHIPILILSSHLYPGLINSLVLLVRVNKGVSNITYCYRPTCNTHNVQTMWTYFFLYNRVSNNDWAELIDQITNRSIHKFFKDTLTHTVSMMHIFHIKNLKILKIHWTQQC